VIGLLSKASCARDRGKRLIAHESLPRTDILALQLHLAILHGQTAAPLNLFALQIRAHRFPVDFLASIVSAVLSRSISWCFFVGLLSACLFSRWLLRVGRSRPFSSSAVRNSGLCPLAGDPVQNAGLLFSVNFQAIYAFMACLQIFSMLCNMTDLPCAYSDVFLLGHHLLALSV
jgi:hypothetical protein